MTPPDESDLATARSIGALSEQLRLLSDKIDRADRRREAIEAKHEARFDTIERRLDRVEFATEATGVVEWLRRHWQIVAVLCVPVPAILTALVVGAWHLHGDRLVTFARKEIERSAVNSEILFQPAGLSFVRSPVVEGGTAKYVLVARRTEFGSRCRYRDTVPIFQDELGNTAVGNFQSRGRQYGDEMERAEVDLPMPDGLRPGRIVVRLQIQYDCDGERIDYTTYPVAFELLPSQAP